MYLILDQGNSLLKTALYRNDSLMHERTWNTFSFSQLDSQLKDYAEQYPGESITHGIISSVVKDDKELITFLESRFKLLILSSTLPLPIKINYKTPETLGNDRIAASVGAIGLVQDSDLLVIDAGTCITYDFITFVHEYMGGGISPGIGMRFKALHNLTSKLPLVSRTKEASLIGGTTEDSIRSGVLQGILAEVDGLIGEYKRLYPGVKVFVTGGDLNYFDKKLKNNIFAVPNLVLLGLKDILKYNVEI